MYTFSNTRQTKQKDVTSEWVEFNAPPDTIQVISEVEKDVTNS